MKNSAGKGLILSAAMLALIATTGFTFKEFDRKLAESPLVFELDIPTGNSLVLYRYPAVDLDSSRPPVLLCHGIGTNHSVWEIGGPLSPTQYLARNGWDVWALDFRLVDGSLDSFASRDIPRAVQFISEKTGAAKVGLAGFDIGGTALLCNIIKHGTGSAAFVVGIGSVLEIEVPSIALREASRALNREGGANNLSSAWTGERQYIPTGESIYDIILFNDSTVPASSMNSFQLHQRPVPPELARQFAMMVAGELKTLDGAFSYSASASKFTAPILMISGITDNLAQTEDVISFIKRSGSKQKEYRLFSSFNSARNDYGHAGLLLGANAHKDIFPVIDAWMRKAR